MPLPESIALLIDEMFSPKLAEELRARSHNVVSVAERPEMRAMPDEEVFAWAAAHNCWLLTENVKDFQPLKLEALATSAAMAGLLFTSNRRVPRSSNISPLVEALDAWLIAGPPAPPQLEDWLQPPGI